MTGREAEQDGGSDASRPRAEGIADRGLLGQEQVFEELLAGRLQDLQRQLVEDFRQAAFELDQYRGGSLAGPPSRPRACSLPLVVEGPAAAAVLAPDQAVAVKRPAPRGAKTTLVHRQPDWQEEAGSSRPLSPGKGARTSALATSAAFQSEQGCPSQETEDDEAAGRPPVATSTPREFFSDEGPRMSTKSGGPRWHGTTSSDVASNLAMSPGMCVIPPNSAFHSAFQLASVLVVSYDAVMTPWICAWSPSWFGYKVISIGLLCFWVLDMVLSFFRGYYSNGEAVVQHRKIALHYIRTWFFVDLAINIADIVSVAAELQSASDAESGDFLAIVPAALRGTRLLRLLKVSNSIPAVFAMRMVRDKGQRGIFASTLQSLGLGAKLVLTLLWLNHLICCLWFFIGKYGLSDTGHSWLDVQPPSHATSYRDTSRLFQYTTSLHWSLTQMTPGSMSLVPQNSLEMSFNICCLFIGLFAGALLVSQLSARIVKVKLETQEESVRLGKLQTYLREHEVSWHLRDRVRGQIQHRLSCESRLTVNDVDLLRHLSQSLRRELNLECFGRYVMSHTLFHTWGLLEPALLESICLHAVELLCFAKDDDIFTSHTVPEKTYFVLKGMLQYSLDGVFFSEVSQQNTSVGEGDWVSEAALWLDCSYSGTLTSRTQCELLAIDVPILLNLLKKFPSVRAVNHHYCAAFHKLFAMSHPEDNRDLGVSCEQLLMAMPVQWRLEIMLPLLHKESGLLGGGSGLLGGPSLLMWRTRSQDLMDELRMELSAGKAIISLINGEVTRTVLLVTLRLVLEETGQVLVRLAKKGDSGRFVAAAALPGTKIRQGEDAQQAVNRMINTDLFFHHAQLDMQSSLTSSETSISRKYRIRSKYMISTFHAVVDNDSMIALASDSKRGPVQHSPPGQHAPGQPSGRMNSYLGSAPAGLSPEEAEEHAALANCHGFLFMNVEREFALYAWMSEALFARMKTARGQEILQSWVTANAGSFSARGGGARDGEELSI